MSCFINCYQLNNSSQYHFCVRSYAGDKISKAYSTRQDSCWSQHRYCFKFDIALSNRCVFSPLIFTKIQSERTKFLIRNLAIRGTIVVNYSGNPAMLFAYTVWQRQLPYYIVVNLLLAKCQIENNTPCVYAIGFKRTTMLEYIYHGHRMAYDPILPVSNRD